MATVKLTNEDDYISPSQSCINPLFTSDRKVEVKSGNNYEFQSPQYDTDATNVQRRKFVRRRRVPLELKNEDDDVDNIHKIVDLGTPIQNGMETKTETKATVSVADCLACSGCITSAEAVLVTTKHSIETLKKQCAEKSDKVVVFTISPAVIADLARIISNYWDSDKHGDLSSNILFRHMAKFLQTSFQAAVVLDGNLPQRISLLESALEFCHRYRSLHSSNEEAKENISVSKTINPRISLATPSIALSATQTRYLVETSNDLSPTLEGIEIDHDGGIDNRLSFLHSSNVDKPSHVLPMLSSSCPGFICYVEKTVPEVVPNLCTSKSPMAMAGSIFKHQLLEKIQRERFGIPQETLQKITDLKLSPCSVYHVAIMPCYDKALEANRKDLAWLNYQEQQELLTPDIDLVITTHQLLSILADQESASNDKSENLEEVACNVLINQNVEHVSPNLLTVDCDAHGSQGNLRGSGSYAEFIFRFTSFILFGFRIDPSTKLQWYPTNLGRTSHNSLSSRRMRSRLRESDVTDSMTVCLYQLEDGTCSMNGDPTVDKVLLRFSTCYGFKNIQLLMQQLSTTTSIEGNVPHFVEVMACPAGCINGGGQAKARSVIEGVREKPSEMRERVEKSRAFYKENLHWSGDDLSDYEINRGVWNSTPRSLTNTRFHVVPKLELSTGATAGVKVDDTLW